MGALTWDEVFPLRSLRLRVADDLELRVPDDTDVLALAAAAHEGIHDPSWTPFAQPWADGSPLERARSVVQWQWRQRGAAAPESWVVPFAVVRDRQVVGLQDLMARDFAVRREVGTGSWLGRRHQGRGTGYRARLAVLSLAFDHLGARSAVTEAWKDNGASNRVTEKVGYARDGEEVAVTRGQRREGWRYRLTVERWRALGHPAVEVEGLTAACRAQLGA